MVFPFTFTQIIFLDFPAPLSLSLCRLLSLQQLFFRLFAVLLPVCHIKLHNISMLESKQRRESTAESSTANDEEQIKFQSSRAQEHDIKLMLWGKTPPRIQPLSNPALAPASARVLHSIITSRLCYYDNKIAFFIHQLFTAHSTRTIIWKYNLLPFVYLYTYSTCCHVDIVRAFVLSLPHS